MRTIDLMPLGGGEYIVMETFAANGAIVVLRGFVTDLASVPRPLWWFIKPSDTRIIRAAVTHDFLYATHAVSKLVADRVFYELMREDGASRPLARVALFAVRWLSGSAYATAPARMASHSPKLAREFKRDYDMKVRFNIG